MFSIQMFFYNYLDLEKKFFLLLLQVFLAIVGLFFTFGFIDVKVSELLHQYGLTDTLISLNESGFCAGFIIASFLVPSLLKKYLPRKLFGGATLIVLCIVLVIALYRHLSAIFSGYFL